MDRQIMNRRNRQRLAKAIAASMGICAPCGFGMYFAGVATSERIRTLFGERAMDKSSFLFPLLCGSLADVEATDAVRNRYPLVFASKTADFNGQIAQANRKQITKYVAVESKKKEIHINLGDDELREGSPVLNDAVGDMVNESFNYWDQQSIALLEANGNGFDSQAFFLAAHNINAVDGAAGTQSNLLSGVGSVGDVVDPTAPTAAEAAKVIDASIDLLLNMQDMNGKLVNKGMKAVVIVCGTSKIATAFKTAVTAVNGILASSAQVNLGIRVTVMIATGIAAGNVYIARADAASKTIVMQETAPETRFTPSDAKDSDNWFTYTSDRGLGLGVYYNVVKVILS